MRLTRMPGLRQSVVGLFCMLLFTAHAAVSAESGSEDKVVIISPHRKSLEREIIPAFKKHYEKVYKTKVDVDWIDQGGTENDLRYVRSQFAANPKTAQIDVFWGGGDLTFIEMEDEGLLAPHVLPSELAAQLPKTAVGVAMQSARQRWYASALSSFGIFYNKRLIKMLKQEEPRTWADLSKPMYRDHLSMADPRHSSSSLVMNIIILKALGWEKGWQTLAAIAGNTKKFTHSSSDPIKAVVSGEASASAAIDFYALAKIGSVGEKNLGFVLPEGETVFNSDPVAILKGAPNPLAAGRFVEFVLSAAAQKLLILPQGHKDGPKYGVLGRLAINELAYKETEGERISALNPFLMPPPRFKLDLGELSNMKRLFGDLIGAIYIDPHADLRLAWAKISKRGEVDEKTWQRFAQPPVTEAEMEELLSKWDDNVLRNRTINAWTSKAQATYRQLASDEGTQAGPSTASSHIARLTQWVNHQFSAKLPPNAASPASK